MLTVICIEDSEKYHLQNKWNVTHVCTSSSSSSVAVRGWNTNWSYSPPNQKNVRLELTLWPAHGHSGAAAAAAPAPPWWTGLCLDSPDDWPRKRGNIRRTTKTPTELHSRDTCEPIRDQRPSWSHRRSEVTWTPTGSDAVWRSQSKPDRFLWLQIRRKDPEHRKKLSE